MIKRLSICLILLVIAVPVSQAQPTPRERVSDEGPYRSQVRIIDERDDDVQTVEELLSSTTDSYGRALILRQLAMQGIASGDTAAAIENLETALSLHSLAPLATAQMQANLGQLYVAARRYDDAARVLRAAIAAGVGDPAVLLSLASANLEAGQFAAAADNAVLAISNRADPTTDWLKLAVYALWKANRAGEAVVWQRRILDAEPDNPNHWLLLAALYQQAGQAEQSLATLSVAAESGAITGTDDWLRLVQLHLNYGTPDIASQWIERLLARRNETQYWQWLAQTHSRAGDDRAALQALQRWATLTDAPDAWLQVGEMALLLSERATAIDALRKASSNRAQGSTRGRALLLLGQTFLAEGRIGSARRAFTEASEYGGGTYRLAIQWLDILPQAGETLINEAPESAKIDPTQPEVAQSSLTPDAMPVIPVEIKTIPALRVYEAFRETSAESLVNTAGDLVKDLIRVSRREKLEWTGPLHIVVNGDFADPAQPLQVGVAAPIRRASPPRGEFRSGQLDEFHCAWQRYEGPVAQLEAAWRELQARVVAGGYIPSGQARQIVLHRGGAERDAIIELQIGIF